MQSRTIPDVLHSPEVSASPCPPHATRHHRQSADKPAEKKPEDKPKDSGGKQRYVIQLAALSDPAKADALKQKLSGLGVSASVSRAETSKGEIHRVRVGPFASQDDAKAVMNKLNAAGVSGIMVPQ